MSLTLHLILPHDGKPAVLPSEVEEARRSYLVTPRSSRTFIFVVTPIFTLVVLFSCYQY